MVIIITISMISSISIIRAPRPRVGSGPGSATYRGRFRSNHCYSINRNNNSYSINSSNNSYSINSIAIIAIILIVAIIAILFQR